MTRTKLLVFIVTILLLASSVFLYVLAENDFLIRKYNIPLHPPGFWDTTQIGIAAESYAQGYDPLVENPQNVSGTRLNYPRIWHLIFALGIDQSDTNLIGSIFVILFFLGTGIYWFSNEFDDITYYVLAFALLSAAVMLGLERANIELVLFFIISLALAVSNSSAISAFFLFMFASVLKLYPVFGIVYLLKENAKRFWVMFLSGLGIFIVYLILTFKDMLLVYSGSAKLPGSSFGMNVWWMGLNHPRFLKLGLAENIIHLCSILSFVMVFMVFVWALLSGLRISDTDRFRKGEHLDGFRAGAGIFIFSFVVINNMDYRLIFLLFTIPQLVSWAYDREKGFSMLPLVTLLAMLFSLWSTFIMRFLGRKATFVLEEFANWVVLAGLLYLFFVSLPGWFSNYLRRPFSRIAFLNILTLPEDK